MKGERRIYPVVTLALLLLCAPAVADNEIFDARGFNPNRDFFSQLPYEHIDPLTGDLLLTFTDLVLPGNAGFDLKIQRTYNSKIYRNWPNQGDTLDEDSWAGVGWTLHLGRVLNPSGITPGPIEMPDGSRHKLFLQNNGSGNFITRDFWVYVNQSPPLLRLPNGVTYTFNKLATVSSGQQARYVTHIQDPFSNTIDVEYMATPADGILTITQDLGSAKVRTVTFAEDGTSLHGLASMTYVGDQTHVWQYGQTQATNAAGFKLLRTVTPPVGPQWKYDYTTASPLNELGTLTTPNGGQITYSYAERTFYLGTNTPVRSPAVITRNAYDRGGTPVGTWTYAFMQGPSQNQTVITSPCSTTKYTFLGVGNQAPTAVWSIGLVQKKELSDAGGLLETEAFSWVKSALISAASETVGPVTDAGIGGSCRPSGGKAQRLTIRHEHSTRSSVPQRAACLPNHPSCGA